MPSIVALDIETTGLDPQNDAIIEIGAVKFNGKRIEDEWSTLINPGRPIPPFITNLTGITNEMVRTAPPLRAVLQDLIHFIGDSPILGHNIAFDLSFFKRQGALQINESVDTYEMAAILLPTASRYNLGSLCQALGVLLPATHRALDDARATHAVFMRLYEEALALPVNLLSEIIHLAEPIDWGGNWIFDKIIRARIRQPIDSPHAKPPGNIGPLFQTIDINLPGLRPVTPPQPLDIDETASLLEYGGPFSHYFEAYEHRPQQVEMLRSVAQALSDGYHLMVEAGTGTGKSFAYLVPAALFATQNDTRIIISTNTINLQEQLIKKDIPDLQAALGIKINTAVLKGRSNYLCPRRLELLRHRGPDTADEMRVLAKILVWLHGGGTGDRGEINLNGQAERDVWNRISAEDDGCKTDTCAGRMGGTCPFYIAKQTAQSAHLLIVNHALLLADIATGSRVLPEYDYVIIDEAHHLESATTSALSFRVTQPDVERLLRELGGTSSGILGRLLNEIRTFLRPSDLATAQQAIERCTDLAFRLTHYIQQFFLSIDLFLEEQREGKNVGQYAQQERIIPATRSQPNWSQVELAWDECDETLRLLLHLIAQLYQSLAELREDAAEDLEDTLGSLSNIYTRLVEIQTNLNGMILNPEPDRIYWVELNPNGAKLILQAAPLHIGKLMEKFLWHEKKSIILTSATLTTHGEFTYLRNRLNADEADEIIVGSPFDYETAAMLYLANDIPEVNDGTNYQRMIETTLIRLAKATGGRMLVLFTSYAQLKRTSQAIGNALSDDNIEVYEQGEGASAASLLENFRSAERAVLLGTRSFWEGVDLPGEALQVLVIVKLPFDVPSDPIVAARSETFDDPFSEYSIPEAILRFRQGFGRLIRTQYDRGIVAILDRRILTKRYGKLFIESLPPCNLKVGPVADLPRIAARWLNL